MLLAFDVNYVDVSSYTQNTADPAGDGEIVLGNFDPLSYQSPGGSDLRVSGGTLKLLVRELVQRD